VLIKIFFFFSLLLIDLLANLNKYNLTTQEIEFLKEKKQFNVCSRYKHYPLSGVKDGKLIGVSGEVLSRISQELNLKFTAIPANSNEEFVSNINTNKCDLISIIKLGVKQYDNIITADVPITRQHFVSIGSISAVNHEELEELAGTTFYVKESLHKNLLAIYYPFLDVIEINDVDEIMKRIKKNKDSYFVIPSIPANTLIQKYGALDYKIVDRFETMKAIGTIGINTKYPEMKNILNKVLEDMGQKTFDDIIFEYKIKQYSVTNYAWLWYVIGIFIAIVIIMQYRYIVLIKQKREIEKQKASDLEEKVKEQTKELIIQKNDLKNQNTQLLKLKEHLEKATKEFKSLFESTPYPIAVVNKKLNLVNSNIEFDRTFLLNHSLDTKNLMEFIDNESIENLSKSFVNNPNEAFIVSMFSANNEKRRFKLKLDKHPTLSDEYIIIFIDVEQEIYLTEQLVQQAKMASLGEMMGNIAHQWRQPLSVISTCASGMKTSQEYGILKDDEIKSYTKQILKNVNYLSQTIETFRTFLMNRKERKLVVLQDEINVGLEIIKSSLFNNQINLINNIDTIEKIETCITLNELSEVIINIINNAKDIIKEKEVKDGWIKLDLYQESSNAVITIEDNGGGIPKDILPKIFEPYFTTKYNSQGTGLGLHMSYRIIVDSFNGKLYVKNTDNGAKFFIEIPITKQ
jgi:signal transduction histidine kinase/ABC-type amino acid transport substrate-binding protein